MSASSVRVAPVPSADRIPMQIAVSDDELDAPDAPLTNGLTGSVSNLLVKEKVS